MDRRSLVTMSAPSSIKIKFLSKADEKEISDIWSPLIPKGGFDGVEFTFDANDPDYDFLAIYEGLPKWADRKTSERFEQLSCERLNTLLITTEPSSIRLDGPNFMKQFGYVLTNKAPDLVKHFNHHSMRFYWQLMPVIAAIVLPVHSHFFIIQGIFTK